MTKRSRKAGWWLAAAVGALPLFASPAFAQFRVGDDGHARDANTQLGSGGYNTARPKPAYSADDVFYGNVSGGRGFRGNVNSGNGNSFRGNLADSDIDRFIQNTSGIPLRGVPGGNNYTNPQAYYGSSRGVAPPPGWVPASAGGGYVPGPTPTRAAGDTRLGILYETPSAPLPKPGEFALPGPVDPSNPNSLISASPLYGVRSLDASQAGSQYFAPNYTLVRQNALGGPQVDDATIQQMRDELNQTIVPPGGQGGTGTAPSGTAPLPGQIEQPFYAPGDARMTNPQFASTVNNEPLGASINSGQGLRQRLLVPPTQQSSQYAELKRRLDRVNGMKAGPKSDEDANRAFNQQVRARDAAKPKDDSTLPPPPPDAATPKPTGPATPEQLGMKDFAKKSRDILNKPPEAPANPDGTPGVMTPAERPTPLKVQTLAQGVNAKGLGDLLKTAEESMRQGKYQAALETYDTADQVAPNNPLVWLGKANAELAASYYARADAHLREAFNADPALLLGQYDLKGFFGEARLNTLTKDLKDIANRNQAETRPLFLLAFISYNTGNERRALAYLDMAEKRAGAKDPTFDLMRKYWSVPADEKGATPATPDAKPLNK